MQVIWVLLPSRAVCAVDVSLSNYLSIPLLGLFTVPGRFRCFSWESAAAVRM